MSKLLPPKMNRGDVKILTSPTVYQGFYHLKKYQLRCHLFNGGMSTPFERELNLSFRVAAALPYDPTLDKVVLIEQFRIGALEDETSPWLLELVAGIMSHQENLEDLLKHEMKEEAGLEIQALAPICDYWASPGGSAERVALFCAKVDAAKAGGIHGLPEEHEDILVHVVDPATAFAAVREGRINNAATIIALQWLELNLEKIKSAWLNQE